MAPEPRRPIRIGNCAGAACDAGDQMLRQCEGGPIDVVTGDFLAGSFILYADSMVLMETKIVHRGESCPKCRQV